jgi:hypothetical protein
MSDVVTIKMRYVFKPTAEMKEYIRMVENPRDLGEASLVLIAEAYARARLMHGFEKSIVERMFGLI